MSFFTKLFLYFLPLISIPIIIHLLGKNRIKTVRFSSLKFLEQLKNDTIKRLKLRQIILLIIRTLLILMIILFFARPYITTSDSSMLPNQGETLILCVDNSHSMMEKFQDQSLLQKQLQDLIKVAKNIQFPITLMTITTTNPKEIVEHGKVDNIEDFQKKLSTIPGTHKESNLNETLNFVLKSVEEKSILQCNLWIISDFQTNENFEDELSVNFKKLSDSNTIKAAIFNVDHIENNRAISDIIFPQQIIEINKSLLLKTNLQFWQEKLKTTLSLFIENERVAQGILKETENSADFEFLPLRNGIITGYISLPEDALPQDDKYYFALNIPEKIKILLVSNNLSSIKNLQQALTAGKEDLIDLQTITPQILSMETLSHYDLLIFHGINELNHSFAEKLEDFFSEGKNLIYIPEKNTDRNTYNQFWHTKVGLPKWQATLQGSKDNYLKIKNINKTHAIFADIWQDKNTFQSFTRFNTIPVFQGSNNYQILMTYSNNQPLLMAKQNEMLLATFLEPEASDFNLSGLFPILIQQMIQFLTTPNNSTEKYFIGDTLVYRNFSMNDLKKFTMKTPDGKSYIMDFNNGKNQLTFSNTDVPGFYRLFFEDKNLSTFAVNISKAETFSQFLQKKEIKNIIENRDNIAIISADTTTTDFKINKELNAIFLIFILLLLIAETLIARINHDTKRTK